MQKSKLSSQFPARIGKYQLQKPLPHFSKDSCFRFALYKDSRGKSGICKLWLGSKKDLKHYWIKNEILAYQVLNNAISQNQTQVKNNFPQITIPNLISAFVSDTKVYFLMDKIETQPTEDKTPNTILASYLDLHAFLDFLAEKTELSQLTIAKRNIVHYSLLFHYYLLRLLVKHPTLFSQVLTHIPHVYSGFIQLVSTNDRTLVLRDLSCDGNLFLNNDNISLIDLESLCITNKIVHQASMVTVESANPKFVQNYLRSKSFKTIKTNPKLLAQFKAMVIYGAVVDAATNTKDVAKESAYLINQMAVI